MPTGDYAAGATVGRCQVERVEPDQVTFSCGGRSVVMSVASGEPIAITTGP